MDEAVGDGVASQGKAAVWHLAPRHQPATIVRGWHLGIGGLRENGQADAAPRQCPDVGGDGALQATVAMLRRGGAGGNGDVEGRARPGCHRRTSR